MNQTKRYGVFDYLGARSFARRIGAYDVLRGRTFPSRARSALPPLHQHTQRYRAAQALRDLAWWPLVHWRAVFIAVAFLLVGRWDWFDELERAQQYAARLRTEQLELADLASRAFLRNEAAGEIAVNLVATDRAHMHRLLSRAQRVIHAEEVPQ